MSPTPSKHIFQSRGGGDCEQTFDTSFDPQASFQSKEIIACIYKAQTIDTILNTHSLASGAHMSVSPPKVLGVEEFVHKRIDCVHKRVQTKNKRLVQRSPPNLIWMGLGTCILSKPFKK